MKIAPINWLQVAFMILVVACPMIGSDWPATATAMQMTSAFSSAALGILSLYAPPPIPATFLTGSGVKAVHIVQGLIATLLTTISSMAVSNAALIPAMHVVTSVGGILMGVLGLFSPKALTSPLMIMRMRRALDAAPPTPKEGLPKG